MRLGELILDARTLSGTVGVAGARIVGGDQVGPSAFQGRARTLVRRRVAMQIRPRAIVPFGPERGRSLVRLGSTLVASCGLLVTMRWIGHVRIVSPTRLSAQVVGGHRGSARAGRFTGEPVALDRDVVDAPSLGGLGRARLLIG